MSTFLNFSLSNSLQQIASKLWSRWSFLNQGVDAIRTQDLQIVLAHHIHCPKILIFWSNFI